MPHAPAEWLPGQWTAIAIGFAVAVLLLGDRRNAFSWRHAAIVGLLLPAPLIVDILDLRGETQARRWAMLFAATALMASWGAVLSFCRRRSRWAPALGGAPLAVLTALVVMLDLAVLVAGPLDDAGYYSNLGARRWVETGRLPYADPQLKGPASPGFGASATYGPVLLAVHLPAQWLLRTPENPPDLDPMKKSYVRPPPLATRLTCAAFHCLGLAALGLAVSRAAGRQTGLAAIAIFASSPYVLGLGGRQATVVGLAFISHVAPVATMLAAYAAVRRPALSGGLLAAAAGILYYPAFAFPAWLGWRWWRGERPLRFAAGFALAGLLIAAAVLVWTPAPSLAGRVDLFVESTVEHQEGFGARQYGSSRHGFWGAHPQSAAIWQRPIAGAGSLLKPSFLLFSALALGSFFLARGRSYRQLAALTAMLMAAVQLWKSHVGGTYVEWYLPFLLIALLAVPREEIEPSPPSALEASR
jgi:hypothetical protein